MSAHGLSFGLCAMLLLGTNSATAYSTKGFTTRPPIRGAIGISNCSDPLACDPTTCERTSVKSGECTNLTPISSGIINSTFATFSCSTQPQLCAPLHVYEGDPTCSQPLQTIWLPCESCLQEPARWVTCRVVDGVFRVFVQSCSDNACGKCEQHTDAGMPPGECYAHPGVPGLYLKYRNLEACAVVEVKGFPTDDCHGAASAVTKMPAQSKCFGGLSFQCE